VEARDTRNPTERAGVMAKVLAALDPDSDEARDLRFRISTLQSMGNRPLRVLSSPYMAYSLKLVDISSGVHKESYGVGLVLRLNNKTNVRLLLDTGASGIAISPKAAIRAGLESLSDSSGETSGIGDGPARSVYSYLASEVRAGEVTYTNFPISAFRGAASSDYEGLMGADVFQRFLVGIDFQGRVLSLVPRKMTPEEDSGLPADRYGAPEPGFHRIFRFGNHLAISTAVNKSRLALFLLDSGASTNLIDTEFARSVTGVHRDYDTEIQGVQGKVNKTSRADKVTLSFAGFSQPNTDILSISLEKMSDSFGVAFGGVMGTPTLSFFKLWINYHDGTVKFDYKPPRF